jgi:hypothetical protein
LVGAGVGAVDRNAGWWGKYKVWKLRSAEGSSLRRELDSIEDRGRKEERKKDFQPVNIYPGFDELKLRQLHVFVRG